MLLSGSAGASESYQPPEGGAWQTARLYLRGSGPFARATGVAVFSCNDAETQHRVQLYAKRVRPGARYTLWLLKMQGAKVAQTFEVTSGLRPLRSDSRGTVSFIGGLPWCPVTRDVFVVKHHPSGSRAGFGGGITVLKGYLPKME
jgi:hypothetical protein